MTESSAAPTSKSAVAALVLGILGVCTCVTSPFAVIFGIIALIQIGKTPGMRGQPLAIVGLALAGVSIFTSGILAAIAIPNFIKYQGRAKQTEAKVVLKMLYTAEQAYRNEKGTFSESREELGWSPEGHRFHCAISQAELLALSPSERAAVPAEVASQVGAEKDRFLGVCVGNIDNDSDLDVWAVGSDGVAEAGGVAPVGMPAHVVDDLDHLGR